MTYLVRAQFPEAEILLRENPSMTALFANIGHADYRRAWTRITTKLPTVEEALHLAQSPDQPVLVSKALDATSEGVPLAFNSSTWAGERVTLTVTS